MFRHKQLSIGCSKTREFSQATELYIPTGRHQLGEESLAQRSTRFSAHSSDPCWHTRPSLVFFAFPYATYLPSPLSNIFRPEGKKVVEACALDKTDRKIPEVHVWGKALSKEWRSYVR